MTIKLIHETAVIDGDLALSSGKSQVKIYQSVQSVKGDIGDFRWELSSVATANTDDYS